MPFMLVGHVGDLCLVLASMSESQDKWCIFDVVACFIENNRGQLSCNHAR